MLWIFDTVLDWFWLAVYLLVFPLRWLLAVLCLSVRYVGSKCFSKNKKESKK